MKKIIFTLLIIAFAGFAHGAWTSIAISNKGDEFFIDTQTLKKDGSSRKVWTLTNYVSHMEYKQQKVVSTKEFVEFDCANDRSRSLTHYLYSEKNGQGTIIDTLNEPPVWSYAVPDSAYYSVLKRVCK